MRQLKSKQKLRQAIRKHKSKKQLTTLSKIFDKYKGKMSRQARREAV